MSPRRPSSPGPSAGSKPELDIQRILEAVPHRYPCLLIDRVVKQSPGSCVAIKNVSIGECVFRGHFPDHPVFPGFLLMEAMAQAGNFIGRGDDAPAAAGSPGEVVLLSAEVRFLKMIGPGDQLIITARLQRRDSRTIRFKSEIHVSGELAAKGTFIALSSPEAA